MRFLPFLRPKITEQEVVAVIAPVNDSIVSKYPENITAIHRDFNEAGDKLVEQARLLLEKTSGVNLKKARQLQELGMIHTKDVVEAQTQLKMEEASEKSLQLVRRYKKIYPGYKFITEEAVEYICQKYGLCMGTLSWFTGFVPLEHIQTMTLFKVNPSDVPLTYVSYQENTETTIQDEGYLAKEKAGWSRTEGNAGMYICAPKKDFISSANLQLNSYRISVVPNDPVVLQKVNGGYFVVCAWGDESHDPVVANKSLTSL